MSSPPTKPTQAEETFDLDISTGCTKAWLVKLPDYITERWNDLNSDEEITLGTLKLPPETSNEPAILTLETNEVNGEDIPSAYELHSINRSLTNTFVFTEQDIPAVSATKEEKELPAIPGRLLTTKRPKPLKSAKRFVRKVIPKRTALIATTTRELSMTPVPNAQYISFSTHRQRLANAPKHTTQLVPISRLFSNTVRTSVGDSSILFKSRAPVKERKDKHVRLAREDVLSGIFECFGEHDFWAFEPLRERLGQPKGALREVLKEVADLHKVTGVSVALWRLRGEFKGRVEGWTDGWDEDSEEEGHSWEEDGEEENDDEMEDDDEDDDEEEVEMEDVPLSYVA